MKIKEDKLCNNICSVSDTKFLKFMPFHSPFFSSFIMAACFILTPTFHKVGKSYIRLPLVAQLIKNSPAMWETWVRSLGWKDPLEKGKSTHYSILAWRIPWTV